MLYSYDLVFTDESVSRGLLFGIPIRGYSGWVCTTESAGDTPDTHCVSRFISSSDFEANEAGYLTDLSLAQQSDDPSTYGSSFENGNWICDHENDDSSIEATIQCTAWLPSDRNDSTHPSIYRFESGNSYSVKGYVRNYEPSKNSSP